MEKKAQQLIKVEEYQKMAAKAEPKQKIVRNTIIAFIVGGLICVLGQLIQELLVNLFEMNAVEAAGPTSVVMIFLGAFLTGLGIYRKLGQFAGAGSIVPISGFANSMVSPALEFKREGLVLGVGAKLFTIAGPVLVYAYVSSFIVGLIYWLFK
jgi:stage V sporulation protein AC